MRSPVKVGLVLFWLLVLAYLPIALVVFFAHGPVADQVRHGLALAEEPVIELHLPRWPSPVGRSLSYRDARARATWEVLQRMPERRRTRLLSRLLGHAPARFELESQDDLLPVYDELEARAPGRATAAFFATDPGGADFAREVQTMAMVLSLSWPVSERARVTSGFGTRINPIRGVLQSHNGIDLSVATGTPVHAPAAGIVRGTGEGPWNGRWVRLDHGSGVSTLFLHNSEILVNEGDRVEAGDTISLSGATGLVTGPHLHYQVHIGGAPVDPLEFRQPDDDATPLIAAQRRAAVRMIAGAAVGTFLPM